MPSNEPLGSDRLSLRVNELKVYVLTLSTTKHRTIGPTCCGWKCTIDTLTKISIRKREKNKKHQKRTKGEEHLLTLSNKVRFQNSTV